VPAQISPWSMSVHAVVHRSPTPSMWGDPFAGGTSEDLLANRLDASDEFYFGRHRSSIRFSQHLALLNTSGLNSLHRVFSLLHLGEMRNRGPKTRNLSARGKLLQPIQFGTKSSGRLSDSLASLRKRTAPSGGKKDVRSPAAD